METQDPQKEEYQRSRSCFRLCQPSGLSGIFTVQTAVHCVIQNGAPWSFRLFPEAPQGWGPPIHTQSKLGSLGPPRHENSAQSSTPLNYPRQRMLYCFCQMKLSHLPLVYEPETGLSRTNDLVATATDRTFSDFPYRLIYPTDDIGYQPSFWQ